MRYYQNVKKFGFIKSSINERINFKVESINRINNYKSYKNGN